MDLSFVSRTEIQDYISANINTNLQALLLKKSPFADVTMKDLFQQIKGRKVAQKKFPFLAQDGIFFPPTLNLEQASSQATAVYKASGMSGKKFLDLTTGFGIDAYYLSENFKEVTLVEQNAELSQIVKHNWQLLGRKARFVNQELETFLEETEEKFDLVYLDPARRDEQKNKKFLLEDLSPNLLEMQEILQEISWLTLVKLSPLIDISYLVSVLKNISEIKIVAVRNEVKELLVYLAEKTEEWPLVTCINLESNDPEFSFHFGTEKNAVPVYAEPKRFLYLPNNALLKSGAFNLIAERFSLYKLHPNTHLYTADNCLETFPGRILRIETVEAKDLEKGMKFNIISKNYPLSPDEIKKKYKIADGGKHYLIFTESVKGKIILKSF